MNVLPQDYLKIMTFNEKFEAFKDYDKRFLAGELSEDEIAKYFWSLKSLLIFYCKYIRYQYKKQGVIINLPVHILMQAKKDNLIQDADTWIEYTKWVNHYFSRTEENYQEIMLDILARFRDKVDSMLDLMHSDELNKFMEDNSELYKEFRTRERIFADNHPEYSPEDMHISERSYKIFLEFFKSHSAIKKVWLHGSRAYGTGDNGSDLDLIFDCEEHAWGKILEEIKKLLIPYFIDAKNITDNGNAFYSAINYGNIKIYDSKDFQVYWEDRKPFSTGSISIDISKVLFQ